MKKVIIVLLLIIIVAGVAGGSVYFIMQKNTDNEETENKSSITENEVDTSKKETVNSTPKVNSTNNNSNTNSNNNQNKQEKVYTYTHTAISGCVITSSNSTTGQISYRYKCENCGTVQSTIHSNYIKSGTLNTSFLCSKCKKTQKVQIETISEYK